MKRIFALIGLVLLIAPLIAFGNAIIEFVEFRGGEKIPDEGDVLKLMYKYHGGALVGMIAILWMGFVVDGAGLNETSPYIPV